MALKYFLSPIVLYSVIFMPFEAQPPPPTRQPIPSIWSRDTINNYPSPQTGFFDCNRPDKSWICDANKALDKESVDQVDDSLLELRENTKGGCPCNGTSQTCTYTGLPIIVTVMGDFKYTDDADLESLMEAYASHLSQNWNFFDCDDCIFYVIGVNVKSKKKVYRHYCEKSAALISEKCRNYMASKTDFNFSSGLSEQIIDALKFDLKLYGDILAKNTTCEEESDMSGTNETIFVAIIIAVIILAVLLATIIAIILVMKRQRQRQTQNTDQGACEPLQNQAAKNA